MRATKRLRQTLAPQDQHWVGDGFPVRSVLSPQTNGTSLSPFILMDYAGPHAFPPRTPARGVDSHPHRGFETVTVVYQGELEHRDSAGNAGSIGPGDVQWMTAASGILHEEKHSRELARTGGILEMAQLWVNLPSKHKMDPPRYQELSSARIPVVELPGGAGTARIIAGAFGDASAAAETFTPVVLWDVTLRPGASAELPIPEGFNAALYVRRGAFDVAGSAPVSAGELAVLSREGEGVHVRASAAADLLVLAGEPIEEPVVAYGPFVMNRPEEIRQAVEDFRAGRFGRLS